MPLISLLTPCRNSAGTIRTNLESAAAQKGRDAGLFEHWLIDGASTDDTLAIARQFPHARVDSRPDDGIADAFNRGARAATGDWLVYCNADDALASPTVLWEMSQHLDPAFDFVYGQVALMDEKLERTLRLWGDDQGWLHLARRQTVPHPSLFTHRRVFEQYGYFDLSYRVNMDYEWLLRSYGKARYKFVPITVTKFRTGGQSSGDGSFRQAKECWRAKTKNHVGTPMARAAWYVYQGTRSVLDARLPGVPLLGPAYQRLTGAFRKTY